MPRKSRARPKKAPPREPKSVVPPNEGWRITSDFEREAMLWYARSGVAGRQVFVQAFWERAKPFFRDRAHFEQWVQINLRSRSPDELRALRSASSQAAPSSSEPPSVKPSTKAGSRKGQEQGPKESEKGSRPTPARVASSLARWTRADPYQLLANSFSPAERDSLRVLGSNNLSAVELSILTDFLRGKGMLAITQRVGLMFPKLSINVQTTENGVVNILQTLIRTAEIYSQPGMAELVGTPHNPATKKYITRKPLGIFFFGQDVRGPNSNPGKPKH
ncbi:MAG: hypothetical protein AABW68_04350 [archaeon]